MEQINVTRSSMPPFEEYCEEIRELWDSRWLTNMGVKHRTLQQELERTLGVEHVCLCTNGHLALELALRAFDLPQGSEVITTPFTFASTTHAIARCGLVPVFCDVDPEDFTLDASMLESLITPRTSAIVPVHVYGNLCQVDAIDAIAKRHGLKVIYDAAHAFGVTRNGVSAACFGDASMFSFHATKVFNTIEGGAVCFRDDALTEKLDDLKNFGLHGEDGRYIGGNAKMNEFQAAMGICNLRHLEQEIARRKAAAERCTALLSGIEGIRLRRPQPGVESNYAYFPVVFDGPYDRDAVFARLQEQGIHARKYFYPLTSRFSCYQSLAEKSAPTPAAEYLAAHVLCLPMYADLTEEDVEKICHWIVQK